MCEEPQRMVREPVLILGFSDTQLFYVGGGCVLLGFLLEDGPLAFYAMMGAVVAWYWVGYCAGVEHGRNQSLHEQAKDRTDA